MSQPQADHNNYQRGYVNGARKTRDELIPEIERLRTALQKVIDQTECVCLWDAQEIARAALKEKE